MVAGSALLVAMELVAVTDEGQGAGVWRSVLKQRGDLLVLPLLVDADEVEEGVAADVVVE